MAIYEWKKRGLIIRPQKRLWWMQTHAMLPTFDHCEGSLCRVYFSGRDATNCSHIGYAVIDINNGVKVLEYSLEPTLTIGELGCFDDNGVTPSCIVNHKGKKYMYYIGWNKRSKVRMSLVAGLAVSDDGGKTFKRFSKAPLLERTNSEPYNILTAPFVMVENDIWKMWYVSSLGWVHEDLPKYNIKYAESKDGIHWNRKGIVCIDFKSLDEHSLARPCVIKEKGIYKMWYSYKGEHYRIGYAESNDGISWKRKDEEAGIDVSESSWDSEMIGLASVIKYKDEKYMVYNGNNYGKEGACLAVSDE